MDRIVGAEFGGAAAGVAAGEPGHGIAVRDLGRVAQMFKAMSHEGRLAALTFMQSGEKTVSELGDFLDLRQPAVSQVLAVLRASGLVQTRRDGKNIYYGLTSPDIVPLIARAARIEI